MIGGTIPAVVCCVLVAGWLWRRMERAGEAEAEETRLMKAMIEESGHVVVPDRPTAPLLEARLPVFGEHPLPTEAGPRITSGVTMQDAAEPARAGGCDGARGDACSVPGAAEVSAVHGVGISGSIAAQSSGIVDEISSREARA